MRRNPRRAPPRSGSPNTADKLRSARPSSAPHDAHLTAERAEHHATPPHSPRFVSFIRLFGDVTAGPMCLASACLQGGEHLANVHPDVLSVGPSEKQIRDSPDAYPGVSSVHGLQLELKTVRPTLP